MAEQLKIILDNTTRTIIGVVTDETDTHLVLKNPCTIYVQPNEQGQLQVQTLPLFFREFLTLDGREKGVTFAFNKDTITVTDAAEHLDDKLKNQYTQVIANFTSEETESEPTDEVVKLFDD